MTVLLSDGNPEHLKRHVRLVPGISPGCSGHPFRHYFVRVYEAGSSGYAKQVLPGIRSKFVRVCEAGSSPRPSIIYIYFLIKPLKTYVKLTFLSLSRRALRRIHTFRLPDMGG